MDHLTTLTFSVGPAVDWACIPLRDPALCGQTMRAVRNAKGGEKDRKSRVLNFRITPSIEAELRQYIDRHTGIRSIGDAARAILLEQLAQRRRGQTTAHLDPTTIIDYELLEGDSQLVTSLLPRRCCQTCVTSPPYFRQRDYGHTAQLGRERTPEHYVARLAEIFTQVHRVLKDNGTLWVVIDDTYVNKQLAGIPWRLALELQQRGWLWRAEIVWHKASLPEPVKDRPTRAHEAVLLFSKSRNYFYDHEAALEPHDHPFALDCIQKASRASRIRRPKTDVFSKDRRRRGKHSGVSRAAFGALMNPNGKNRRDVWVIQAERHRGEHSAAMPVELADLCIRATTKPGDLVLDPFTGTGTSGVAALQLGRRFVGVELIHRFVEDARNRLESLQPMQ